MISCIICSRHPNIPNGLRENIASTIGCEYELIVIDNSRKEYSIFSAYNEGVRRAKGDILCFMHDDIVAFHTNRWGLNVEKHFEEDAQLGLVGISGSHFLPNTPAEWYHCQLGSGGCIQTVDGVTENSQHLENFKDGNTILEAVIVDGMWMCIRQTLFAKIHFDVETFSGWHCYDTDICLQVINEGYKVAIISNVLLEHSSWGNLTLEWVEATRKVYAKWSHILPLVRGFEMSADEIELRTKMIAIAMNYIFTIVKQENELKNIRSSYAYRIGKHFVKPLSDVKRMLKKINGGGVDVVLITYNQESYIAKAVESILMQRVNDDVQVRVIVADDCSKDKTLEIIKSYEEKSPFPFVYLPAEQNMGVAANYKRAFEATEADYVAVMEGDDWWCDTYRLQKHVDYLSIHPDCVMTKNNYMQYSQRNNVWSVEQANVNILTLKQSLKHYVLANMSCTMFRGELLRKMDERVYEYGHNQWCEATDWYTHIYLLQKGYGYVLDEVMSVYRVDTGENISRTERTDNEMLDKAYLCYEQTMMLLGKDYKDECYEIYLATKRDVERDKICKRIIKWSNYMPPFMAIFFTKTFPNVLWHCKHIIRQCIPHKVYYKLKRKK